LKEVLDASGDTFIDDEKDIAPPDRFDHFND